MTTDNFCFYLQNRLIQTSQTGGQRYSDTSPFSIPWLMSAFLFSPSLILALKARCLLLGDSTWVGSTLACICQTRVELAKSDKDTSLQYCSINYDCKRVLCCLPSRKEAPLQVRAASKVESWKLVIFWSTGMSDSRIQVRSKDSYGIFWSLCPGAPCGRLHVYHKERDFAAWCIF